MGFPIPFLLHCIHTSISKSDNVIAHFLPVVQDSRGTCSPCAYEAVCQWGVACAGMVLLVFCNGLLDAWLLLSNRSPIAMENEA